MDSAPTAAEILALQRAGFLLGPSFAAVMLVLLVRPSPRQATAAMVGFLWQLPALLLLHLLAREFGWWRFAGVDNVMFGLPVDVWIGWALWWGPVATLLNRWLPMSILIAASIAIDAATMPILGPLVTLGSNWLAGEALAIALCLYPGLILAKLTREDRLPKRRAMFHVLGWGGYMLLVLPVCVLAYENRALHDLYRVPDNAVDWLLVGGVLALLFIGIAATAEFARTGDGTPIPFDPPKRVVASGPYAFIANPMQIISAAVMLLLAFYARSWGLGLVAAMFALFDTVYASWYNRAHIARAMPDDWQRYREAVPDWRMLWRPHVSGEAEVIISPDGPARRIWDRVWPAFAKQLTGKITVTSEERPRFRRLVYRRPAGGIEDYGIKAAARILEHGAAPLAMLGWLIRFPYLGGALQRLSLLVIVVWRRYTGVKA
jgi:protein-S-isoprenylcysteine O-methyltransferase Ste14